MNWSIIGHDRRHCKAPSSTDHYLQAISRVWLDWHWWEHGRQNGTPRILVGLPILFFRMWNFGPGLRGKRGRKELYALCQGLSGHCSVRSHLGSFRIVEDLMCVCAEDYETVDHLIWQCERFRVERHRLIDALAALNVGNGIPIRDLCALKKWSTVKCWSGPIRLYFLVI
jgi:hypothetical protein